MTAIKFIGEHRYPNGERGEEWLCKCDCGNELVVLKKNLLNGNTQSCGCTRALSNASRLTTHGAKNTKLYAIWCSMKDRCTRNNNKDFEHYGGRGIKVCEEWMRDFSAFRDWAIESGYNQNLTIDRINVNGNYCPDNCRWVDWNTQANNRTNSIYIEYNGETHTCAEWSKITGINYYTLRNRMKAGMNIDDILYPCKHKSGPNRNNKIHNDSI